MPFAFEKLEVYQKTLSLILSFEDVINSVKGKVSYNLIDQLSRAAISISLNIAEGNGRWHANDKKNFMVIARGSAFECVPILQILKSKNLIHDEIYNLLYQQLLEISKMLSALISYFGNLK